MDINEKLRDSMREIDQAVDLVDNDHLRSLSRFLRERITYPESYVVLLGETSCGKTTLLNGLLGQGLLATSAKPSTGTVVEIMDQEGLAEPQFFAVNTDATLEVLSYDTFSQLTLVPDQELLRLRLCINKLPFGLTNLRLFDTPGYGSINEQHEEVLKEFIPECDVLIYVVSYRIGMKENDHNFMQLINELLPADSPVYLVINRAPKDAKADDKRVNEIQRHAEDCLHRKLPLYIVPTVTEDIADDSKRILPTADLLWQDLAEELESEERRQNLFNAFRGFQKDLLLKLRACQEKKLAHARANTQEQQMMKEHIEEFLGNEKTAQAEISHEFQNLDSRIEALFDYAANRISEKACQEIESSNRWSGHEECSGFIQNHLLPLQVKCETRDITNFIQERLEDLDERINSLLNTAVIDFEKKISLCIPIYEPLIRDVGIRLGKEATQFGLQTFFKQYGGAGGSAAGVANAAKRGLKKLGDLFGKKFSRETHNALAHSLKKIGATSIQAICVAATAIVEGLVYAYDVITWPGKLRQLTNQGIENWKRDTASAAKKYLQELEDFNRESVRTHFEEYRKMSDIDTEEASTIDMEQEEKTLALINSVLQKFEITDGEVA